jgi:integrase
VASPITHAMNQDHPALTDDHNGVPDPGQQPTPPPFMVGDLTLLQDDLRVVFRRHAKKGYFYLEFSCKRKGLRRQFSLGSKDPEKASEAARVLTATFVSGEFDPWNDPRRPISLADAITKYGQIAKRDGIRKTKIAKRISNLSEFARAHHGKLLRDITLQDAEAFYLAKSLSDRAKKASFRTLYRLFAVGVECRLISFNPLRGVQPPSAEKEPPVFLRKEEYVRLIDAADSRMMSDRDADGVMIRDVIQLAVSTGLSCRELCSLKWSDVDLGRQLITVTSPNTVRHVPIFPLAQEVFEARSRSHDFVFSSAIGSPLNERWVTRRFREERILAELPETITFASLRDTFASWLAIEGASLKLLRDWTGMSSTAAVEKYVSLQPTEATRYHGAFVLPAGKEVR